MIWDEKLQDRGLLSFFQNLIKFRKEYLPIINNSVLHYQAGNEGISAERQGLSADNPVHQWHFIGSEGALVAVYSGAQAVKFDAPGACVFGPEPDLALYETGLPPYTLAVYNKKA
jgi:hypothetical protein